MANVNVFIVEDESVIAMDIQMCLEKKGYTIVGTASNNKDAIEKIEKTDPDIILMDIMIKGDSDGIDTAKQVLDLKQIPIIFLTAYADQKTIERAKDANPYGYILKPFKEVDLYTTIEIALSKFKKDKDAANYLKFALLDTVSNNSIFVKTKQRIEKVWFTDLLYVEALKDYVVLKTSDKNYTVHSTMKDMAAKLPNNHYTRVHRSYIVKTDRIKAIEDAHVVMDDKAETKIPIGKLYKKDLTSKLNFA